MEEKKEIEFISNDKLWIFSGKYNKDDMPVYTVAPESKLKLNEEQKKYFDRVYDYLHTLDELINEEYTIKDLKEQNFPLSEHIAKKFRFFIFKEFGYEVD